MLTTTILRSHHQWIQDHLRCAETEGTLPSRAHHFYRLASQGPNAPYVPENLLPPVSGSADGSMISFMTFGCKKCDSHLETPSKVYADDLIFLEKNR